tara:strand:- start:8017 stop:8685 length:669 start_codon:yes stop_codon:yes gene_type:complete
MNEVILDTETTGLSVKEGHRLVEIGCIELNDLVPTKKVFHCYLNPERKVSEKAFEIHGYSDEFLSDKKKFKEIVDDFLDFIKDKKIIIHNAEFDLAHINNELSLIGKKKITNENVIDTLEIARDKFPGAGISLDALCKRYNIDNSRRKKHSALIDCELLAKVYINLLDQREPSLNFNKIDKSLKNEKMSDKIIYAKKIIIPSNIELENHNKFLKNHLKKNFY